MTNNNTITALIETIRDNWAGVWIVYTEGDKLPDGNYFICYQYEGRGRYGAMSTFINGKWTVNTERTKVLQYLSPSESTREQILSLLSCLVIEESDFQAYESFQLNADTIPSSYQVWKAGLTHARLQMQAEIKASEEKVKERDQLMNLFVKSVKRLQLAISNEEKIDVANMTAKSVLDRYNQLQQS